MIRAAALSLLLAAPALAQHSVWVVAPNPGPGVDFTDPWTAVLAAESGDTILVKTGTWPSFGGVPKDVQLPAKTLSITADTGAVVQLDATELKNLPEGYLLTLSHINFKSTLGDEPALTLQDDAGAVWLDHCTLIGFGGIIQMQMNPSDGLKITNCASVVVTHSTLVGWFWALEAANSEIFAFRSTITGAASGCNSMLPPGLCGTGGTGISVSGGLLALQSSLVAGGAANPAPGCFHPGTIDPCLCYSLSGSALQLQGGAQVEAYDVQISAGAAASPCGSANPVITDIVSGQLDSTAGPGFELTGASPLRVGQSSSFDVSGQPGDSAWAVLAIPPAAIWASKFNGPWLTGGAFQLLFIGTVPASGGMSFAFSVPPLPPGFESVEFISQGVRIAPGTGTLLANPVRAILLDSSF